MYWKYRSFLCLSDTCTCLICHSHDAIAYITTHLCFIIVILLFTGHIRVERLRPRTRANTSTSASSFATPTLRPITNMGDEGDEGSDADVFCWEGNLNTILGQSSSLPLVVEHTKWGSSPSPFGGLGGASVTKSSSSSSSSSLLDHPSTIVLPERVRAYVLIAQRGLGRCLQELHATTSNQGLGFKSQLETTSKQGLGSISQLETTSKSWQPIVLVEAL